MLLNVCPHCDSDVLGREFGKWICFTCGRTTEILKTIEAKTERQLREERVSGSASINGHSIDALRYSQSYNSGIRAGKMASTSLKVWYEYRMKKFDDYIRA